MEGVPAVPVRGQLALIWLSVALFLGRHFIITPYATQPYVVCNWVRLVRALFREGVYFSFARARTGGVEQARSNTQGCWRLPRRSIY